MQEDNIKALAQLGNLMRLFGENKPWPGFDCGLSEDEFDSFTEVIIRAKVINPWFTEENSRSALKALGDLLYEDSLHDWLKKYDLRNESSEETVALIMAGNIPLVGFHDFICSILSGYKTLIKLSSDDNILMPKLIELLFHFQPGLKEKIFISDGKLEGFDKVIATGSNNTSRYFEHYFGKYPNIIRKNRTSVAILDGSETAEQLEKLGDDIFAYFGLGCRNVSKLYLPRDYDLDTFFNGIFSFGDIVNHHKYGNNYDYNKAIWLLNNDKILDNGFLLLKESHEISAPTATLYYEFYDDLKQLGEKLKLIEDQIQCVVSKDDIPFGKAQCPGLSDFADNVDTMKFLMKSGD